MTLPWGVIQTPMHHEARGRVAYMAHVSTRDGSPHVDKVWWRATQISESGIGNHGVARHPDIPRSIQEAAITAAQTELATRITQVEQSLEGLWRLSGELSA